MPLVGLAQNLELAAQIIAPALCVVSFVVGGLAYANDRGGHHSTLSNVFIGAGIALAAISIVSWIPRG